MPAETENKIRAFIAIEIPAELIRKLQEIQDDMKRSNLSDIKWVDTLNIHLTLKFLASISETTINKVVDVLQAICSLSGPFMLETSTLGAFPTTRRPRVFWLGLQGDVSPLLTLQKTIDEQLVPLGFVPEARAFTPHLTLARLREDVTPATQQSFGELISKTRWHNRETWIVKKVTLMRSQLQRAGPVYSQLAEIELISE